MQKLSSLVLKQADYERPVWVVTVSAALTSEDLLKPVFWANVAGRLAKWHQVEVRADDGSWFAILMVIGAGQNWAKVQILQKFDLVKVAGPEAVVPETEDYEVLFRGVAKWCVRRVEDKAILFKEGESKAAAARWLTDHLRAIAA